MSALRRSKIYIDPLEHSPCPRKTRIPFELESRCAFFSSARSVRFDCSVYSCACALAFRRKLRAQRGDQLSRLFRRHRGIDLFVDRDHGSKSHAPRQETVSTVNPPSGVVLFASERLSSLRKRSRIGIDLRTWQAVPSQTRITNLPFFSSEKVLVKGCDGVEPRLTDAKRTGQIRKHLARQIVVSAPARPAGWR